MKNGFFQNYYNWGKKYFSKDFIGVVFQNALVLEYDFTLFYLNMRSPGQTVEPVNRLNKNHLFIYEKPGEIG